MLILNTIEDVKRFRDKCQSQGKTLHFVPTMGALHNGHMSLIRAAGGPRAKVLASIFVNPTQFNQESDLQSYPRTPEADIKMLEENGCHGLFMPSVEEVYPKGTAISLDYKIGDLEKQLEGEHRPGHFAGVVQVVHRLLEIVKPDAMCLGEKDAQQLLILSKMVRDLALPTRIIPCPIIREVDGLAMSSRNRRLDEKHRAAGLKISQALFWTREYLRRGEDLSVALNKGRSWIEGEELLKMEYFECVDQGSLQRIKNLERKNENGLGKPLLVTAVWAGDVRLIDNLKI